MIPVAHEISTPELLEVDSDQNIQFHTGLTMFLYFKFKLFCYIIAVFLYSCICNPIGSSHDDCNINANYLNIENNSSILCIDDDLEPHKILKRIKVSNVNRLIIGQLNINSLRNKIEALKLIMMHNIDILIITETKLNETFPNAQFHIDGYAPPFRVDRSKNGGGIIIYVREDIPAKKLEHPSLINFEGIFIEIKLKNRKWLVFGGYNPDKHTINNFLTQVSHALDFYMTKYDNFLLLGDFNSEMSETSMIDFCDTHNLNNLIKEHTCYKNPDNPSTIDLILTNRPKCFQNSTTIETGLSDFHKLTITVMKSYYPKQTPLIRSYRDYKNFDQQLFQRELFSELYNHFSKMSYNKFEEIVVRLLNQYAHIKERYIRANISPFMNKTLTKAAMTRSRLHNRFIKNPTPENKTNYKKYRNFCTGLFRKEKSHIITN